MTATDTRLSKGILNQIINEGIEPQRFVVQMLQSRPTQKQGARKTYRVAISDGVNYTTAILTSSFNEWIESKQLKENSLITVERYQATKKNQGKPSLLILLKIEILDNTINDQIGMPTKLCDKNSQGSENQTASGTPAPVSPPGQQYPPQTSYPSIPPPAPTPPQQVAPSYQPPQQQYQPPQQQYQPPQPSRPAYHEPAQESLLRHEHNIPPTNVRPPQTSSILPAMMSAMSQRSFIPISRLTSYLTAWRVKARIVKKNPLRSIPRPTGDILKILNIVIQDQDGDQIQGVFFGTAAETFDTALQQNHIYEISGGRIRMISNKKFNQTKHDYEITFDDNSSFTEVPDDGTIGFLRYNFVPINQIIDMKEGTLVDVIGVASEIDAAVTFSSQKTHKDYTKKRILICDTSNSRIEVTLWGKEAEEFGDYTGQNPIIAFKDVSVNRYNGVSLSVNNSATYVVDPIMSEAEALRNWWSVNGQNYEAFSNLTSGGNFESAPEAYLSLVNERGLGMNKDKGDFFSVYVQPTLIGTRKLFYLACPNEACRNKSVSQRTPGEYTCNACGQVVANPVPRFTLSLTLADFSGSIHASLLGDDVAGKLITGKTAAEWAEIAPDGGEILGAPFLKHQFRYYHMKLRARGDDYNGVMRPKVQIQNAAAINYAAAAKFFLGEIRKFK